jgi:amidohydrolase
MNAPVPNNRWIEAGEALLAEITALRRDIHREPELGLHTPLTTAKARKALEGLPLTFREGPSTTGFVAVLEGARPGRTVLLRGDMDALPLQEDVDVPFKSQITGAMHACGHDTHVAMLVGAAKALCARRDDLAGTILFMFQPGEEGWHGARHMLDDGLLEALPDAAFALHINPNLQTGTFAGRAGPLLASSDSFEVIVTGRGGHAAMPHDTIDPMPIACEIVGAIQAMVTRRIPVFDPALVTVTQIKAADAYNVIADKASMGGTIRSFSESSGDLAREGIARVAAGVAAAHGATAETRIDRGFPATICDGRMVELSQRLVEELFGAETWMTMPTPVMGAEDFSYVLNKVPGAMIMLGATPDGGDWRQCCPLHSNQMKLDESAMARGVALHCAVAEAFLRDGFTEA